MRGLVSPAYRLGCVVLLAALQAAALQTAFAAPETTPSPTVSWQAGARKSWLGPLRDPLLSCKASINRPLSTDFDGISRALRRGMLAALQHRTLCRPVRSSSGV